MPTLEVFLDEQQSMVEDLEKRAALAYWAASLSGTKEDEQIAADLSSLLQTQYSSAHRLHFLLSIGEPSSHDLRRQRKLLIDSYRAHQSSEPYIAEVAKREMEIESIFSNFRATLDGVPMTDNALREIFKKSDDPSLRRKAWEATKQIGASVSGKVLELVRLRNQEAKRLGFTNYYTMQVELQELDEQQLFDLLDSVAEKLSPHFSAYKAALDHSLAERFSTTATELRPWHYANPFFQDAPESDEISLDSYFIGKDLPEIAKLFFSSLGLDISKLLTLSDLYEKPGKMQHAYCTTIGRATHDVRILCNIAPNAQWMATLLHELGHAVYDDCLDETLPFFLREFTHIMTTEAIAELMGRFVDNGAWLRRYAGVAADDAEKVSSAALATHRAHLLIFTQWVLVMAHFERELYNNPDQDLDELWWSLVERFQQLHRPEGKRHSDWAAKIHLATSPVYYHNYLLGEMTASQILAALKKDVVHHADDLVSSPAVGAWLKEKIFAHGARYDWNELLNRATGEHLNPQHFIDGIVE